MNKFLRSAAIAALLATGAGAAQAETAYGLREGSIVIFDTATPGTINFSGALSGVAGGEWLVGIDFRPADRQLYGLGAFGNLYTITQSGGGFVATMGPSLTNAMGGGEVNPNGANFGFDFNPVADRLRLHSGTEQNLRINVDTGVTIVDGTLTNLAGGDPDLIGAAYTNNVAGAASTQLFAIDEATDSLVLFTSANNGTFNTVGPLGVVIDASDHVGFDISGATGVAYLSVRNSFYRVDLNTGSASLIGAITGGEFMDFSIAAVPEPATWAMMIGGFGLIGAAVRRRCPTALA